MSLARKHSKLEKRQKQNLQQEYAFGVQGKARWPGGWCRMSKEENAKREEGIRGP